MGEVYRASDTRLNRVVAIKILPPYLAEDPAARERFGREAHTLSAVSHPNICHLYDLGTQNGINYLVMEYLEGESLADRLRKGPMPLDQALRYGVEICEGLERAHRSGVVHRDLKPGNIMLTKSGAKLLDFGLAKSTTAEPLSELTQTRTASPGGSPITGKGTFVGTMQYLSPEQMQGKEATTESDIFAFGAVLYEMVTGKRAFDGSSMASVVAAVLERTPPAPSILQPASPPELDRIIAGCMAKDPDDRWRSAFDIKLQLAALREQLKSGAKAVVGGSRPSTTIAWALAGILALVSAWLAIGQLRVPQAKLQRVRASLLPPANWSYLAYNQALSPDGSRLAFVGVGPDGHTSLWVRSLATGAAQSLPGTEGATLPFWSPEGTRIGFFADSKLKIADASGGGLPQALSDATFGRGGTWNRDGTILFAPDMFGMIYRISDKGGTPVAVTQLPRAGSSQAHRWPFFLPDGKHFLFTIDWSLPEEKPGNGIYVDSLDGGDPKLVIPNFIGNVVFASGRLIYVKDLMLVSQPFDTNRMQVTDTAVPITESKVVTNDSFGNSGFSASQTGVIAFQTVSDLASQLAWFNARGEQVGEVLAAGPSDPRVSPDGRFVVFASDEAGNGKNTLRLYDLARHVSSPLTEEGLVECPSWSSDGKKLVYFGRQDDDFLLYQIPADGSGPKREVWRGARMRQPDYGPHDQVLFSDFTIGRPRIAVLSISERKVTVMHRGAEPNLSPNGQWLIYTFSTGRPFHPEVFLEPLHGTGARIQISASGGAQGAWSHDGRQIFFIGPDKKMMAVDFDDKLGRVSAPRVLFQTRIVEPNYVTRQYDVAPDGRFLINSLPPGSAPPVTMITNWEK